MGFCLHNNAAVSALAAQAAGAKKVLIVDWVRSIFFSQVVGPITVLNSLSHNSFSFLFILLLQDVHHGNGTQEIFEQNKSVWSISNELLYLVVYLLF